MTGKQSLYSIFNPDRIKDAEARRFLSEHFVLAGVGVSGQLSAGSFEKEKEARSGKEVIP